MIRGDTGGAIEVGDEEEPVGDAREDDELPPPRWMLIPKPRLSEVRRLCPNPWTGFSMGRIDLVVAEELVETVGAGREGRRAGGEAGGLEVD